MSVDADVGHELIVVVVIDLGRGLNAEGDRVLAVRPGGGVLDAQHRVERATVEVGESIDSAIQPEAEGQIALLRPSRASVYRCLASCR